MPTEHNDDVIFNGMNIILGLTLIRAILITTNISYKKLHYKIIEKDIHKVPCGLPSGHNPISILRVVK